MHQADHATAEAFQPLHPRNHFQFPVDRKRGGTILSRHPGPKARQRLLIFNRDTGSILFGSRRVVLTIGMLGIDDQLPDLAVQLFAVIQVQAFEQFKANALAL